MIGRIVKSNDTLKVQRLSGSTTGSTPLGAILAFYNDVIPTGFLLCDGSTFSVSDYPELYSLLGTNKVPDLREMTLKGAGRSGLDTITSHVVISLGGTAKSVKGEYSGMNLTGVHFIIKAIPGIEKTEVNYALDRKQSKAIEPLSIDEHTFDTVESALDALNQYCDKINSIISSELPAIEWVNALPASPNIKQKLYIIEENHKLKYYVGDSNLQTLTEMETGGSEAFVGTLAEWNALTDSEKSEYTTANILDGGGTANVVTDEVTSGNMNPVTSNAVASSISNLKGKYTTSLNIDINASGITYTDFAPFYGPYMALKTLTADQVKSLFKPELGSTSGWLGFYNGSSLMIDGVYTARWNQNSNGNYWGYIDWHGQGIDITFNYNPNENKWYIWNCTYYTDVNRSSSSNTVAPEGSYTVRLCDDYWSPCGLGTPSVIFRHCNGGYMNNYFLSDGGLHAVFTNPLSITLTQVFWVVITGPEKRVVNI